MFRFSADQRHALEHGVQDLGKLTLAVLFLGSAISVMPLKPEQTGTKPGLKQEIMLAKPLGNGLSASAHPLPSQF
jgi:hypothetical protein